MKGKQRTHFMRGVILGLLFCASTILAAPRYNIILFYVDDLGWMDLQCQGSSFYETPNIDRLAQEGVRYTQGYAAHPRCLPSRYGLVTGCFPARFGVPGGTEKFKPGTPTFAQALKDGGYATCFVGKWHLSHGDPDCLPEAVGFDVNIAGGDAGSPPTYFYPYRKKPISELKKGWEMGLSKDALFGLEDGKPGDYLTDVLTEKSIDFIRENKDRPFFLELAHYGVHTPFEAPKEKVEKYRKKLKTMHFDQPEYMPVGPTGVGETKGRQDNPVYAAMIESVDDSLGRIVQTLKELGIEDRTLIVFSGDNGGLSNRGAVNGKINRRPLATSNLPLRTGKGWLYEGGIRVPFIVKWPGVTRPGTLNTNDVVIQTDLFPTFLEVAGLPLQPQNHKDGESIVPSLRGKPFQRTHPLFWNSPASRPYSTGDTDSSAVRLGNYKLLEWYHTGRVELYDLSNDPGEQHDLSKTVPEKTEQMQKLLHDWWKQESIYRSPKQRWSKK